MLKKILKELKHMIISHKHKFIFLKPRKVAGTSVEINLAKHCGSDDIITGIKSNNQYDSDICQIDERNNNIYFYNHIPSNEIKNKIDKAIWDNYYKITIVRNPWDFLVSSYNWDKKITSNKININKNNLLNKIINKKILKKIINTIKMIYFKKILSNKKNTFSNYIMYITNYLKNYDNRNGYYLEKNGIPICDFYIRFEYLDEDYKKVCKKIGIPYEPLPKTKNKTRDHKKHYSKYYDEKTKEIVAKKFKQQIDYFGYKFEENGD